MSFSKRLLSGAGPAIVPGENFKVVTYTGNGTTQAITGVGFKPDWVWCKRRNEGSDHNLSDSTRGVMTGLNINSNAAEGDQDPLGVTSFDSDGFTVSDNDGGGASVNGTNDTYVAWCWKAAGGTTSSNTDGSTTSTVQANKAAGFSIVTYTGTGSNASVGHGLGAPAKFIMIKKRSASSDWAAFTAIDNTKYLEPNGTPPFRTANVWQNTDPTSTVFTLTTGGDTNGGSATFVAYCFADVEGYQKFGSYDGNGSTNGPIVNVGFEPAFVMVKNLDSTEQWLILDNKRNTANPRNNLLQMNLSNAESTESGAVMNFYSNGFQSVGTGGGGGSGQINSNGDKYLYWAIAADPPAETPTLTSSFNIETYTGTNVDPLVINGLGFSPGFVWIKVRDASREHILSDIVRGPNKELSTNATDAEESRGVKSFDSDGFTLDDSTSNYNHDGENYVSWTWKAGDFEPAINTNGSLTSFVSANDNAGFSIVSYTGDGNSARTVGHGLSAKCDLVIIKDRDSADKWPVQLPQIGDNARMVLEGTAGKTDDSTTAQAGNATVFGIGGDNAVNKDGDRYIAYCFRNVTGYQKIGTFTGDGNNDRTITTGFKPDFVLIKSTVGNDNWRLYDTKRGVDEGGFLEPNRTDTDNTGDAPNLLMTSTGFTITSGGVTQGNNANGNLYFYWAIAKNVPSNTTLASSFGAVFYAGSSTNGRTISTYGFKPDLVWNKALDDSGYSHFLTDSLRGGNKVIQSNSTGAETTRADNIISFDSGGYTIDNDGTSNYYRTSYIAWGWKAGNQWQSNVNGTIPSTVNANTANGFSIIKYRGTSASSQSVGHGLSSTPELVIIKKTSGTEGWIVWYPGAGTTNYLDLSSSDATSTGADWGGTHSSTVVNLQNGPSARSGSDGQDYIAYVWHSVSGYSKIGTYTGNGSTQSITGLGFQPDWLMIKQTNGSNAWRIFDSLRGLSSPQTLFANLNTEEDSESNTVSSFDSDGFTMGSQQGVNDNGDTYIYMAFAKNATDNNTLANSFKVKTWTGNGSTQEITGIGFKPDLVWIKQTNDTNPHSFFDTTRGAGKMLVTSTTAEEINNVGDILGYFLDDGFQVNRNHGVNSAYDNSNHSSSSYVAWCWKAGNGWQSNINGTISSLVNANTANGFSIIKYVGDGATSKTVGHGLSSAPEIVIIKRLDTAKNWPVWVTPVMSITGSTSDYILLNSNAGKVSAASVTNLWGGNVPTSTTIGVGDSSESNASGGDYIAYCWHTVSGYSKIGTYTGNGSASGTVVEPGFSPDFVLVKRTDNTSNWGLFDSERSGSYYQKGLLANAANSEYAETNSNSACEFLAVGHGDAANGGFRFRDSGSPYNVSSGNYIYMAFKMN